MASLKLSYDSVTSLTVTGAATLANNTSATSDTITNTTTLYVDILGELLVTTGSGASSTGIVEIWGKGSIDGTDFDDDNNDRWLGTLALPTSGAASYKKIFTVASAFGGTLPAEMQIRLRNATGAALTACTVAYRGVTLQSV